LPQSEEGWAKSAQLVGAASPSGSTTGLLLTDWVMANVDKVCTNGKAFRVSGKLAMLTWADEGTQWKRVEALADPVPPEGWVCPSVGEKIHVNTKVLQLDDGPSVPPSLPAARRWPRRLPSPHRAPGLAAAWPRPAPRWPRAQATRRCGRPRR